ncbi:aspartate/tyrosine/aromatic aminotransferase [Saccharophagus sp. K07]|jgi:aspartate aminotransferase|uniref:amino acid aminotransferase n=1 Tax=Saccharophagus sp. K07 TaxID=2283636 RepID=UPI0016525CA2|nr:amino acid aminotransferase [Saccharophagus sp. K07]MBC6905664.1 aspartate/tyrosine/aromatic aminotransferase [Saccharophagus sp. K07]
MFERISTLPADPILGLMGLFRNDPNPRKVDLGVGIYKNERGETPVLPSIAEAERRLISRQTSKAYVGLAGNTTFNAAMSELLLGPAKGLAEGRFAAVQAPGGCGALRVAAELIKVANPSATIWVSNPTWGNHIPLLGNAGLAIRQYPYFDAATSGVDFAAMMSALAEVKAGDFVLLHGCCHNPTGADLSPAQWREVAALAQKVGFIPFVDIAYQGFADDLDADAYGLRYLVDNLPEVVVAASSSKNFGVYRERVGLVGLMAPTPAIANAAMSHMLAIARGIYSMPPDHGAALVAEVLTDAALRARWIEEVAEMRNRINGLRREFSDAMRARLDSNRFDFVQLQKGMFSYLGLTEVEVLRLREKYSIYMLNSARTSISGLNRENFDYVCDAVANVVRGSD